MAIVHLKRCLNIALVTAIATVSLLWIYRVANFTTRLSHRTELSTKLRTNANGAELATEDTSVPSPVVVKPSLFDSGNDSFKCRRASLMNMTFPICHYTATVDDTVSGLLLRGIYFESDQVTRFLRLLRLDPQLQLVDIGANIGLYSLPAARVAQVLAIEPNWHSMARLAKAVHLGSIASNITLVQNALSDVRTTLNMGVHPHNQGTAFVMNRTQCKVTPNNKQCITLSPTETILLNDLLPLMRTKAALMKVDVEGHEVNVFTDATAGEFFDKIHIPVVFMEWTLCKRHPPDLVQRLLDFFFSRNYSVSSLNNSKLPKHYRYLSWPDDVMFQKSTDMRF